MTKANPSFTLNFADADSTEPLAAKLRPKTLEQYIGQQHILAPDKPLYKAISSGQCQSIILYGPPGVGKTTLVEIIAGYAKAHIERVSAVTSGIKDIRQAIAQAKSRQQHGEKTLLFVDEVHRFNKSQQDAFLPHIEDGTIIFIGATTENPAFELNNALLSRASVYQLKKLDETALSQVLTHGIEYYQQQQLKVEISQAAQAQLIALASGDARRLLNIFEQAVTSATSADVAYLDEALILQIAGSKMPLYDKGGDAFYDLISAFHKSVRGSDPDAALYWYARILTAGGDALYVARRLLAIASEDIGNADPRAMQLALNAWDTFTRVGPAEGERAIAQACVYLALAPKSNAVYTAFKAAKQLAEQTGDLDVPNHLKNAPTQLAKQAGVGQGYRYAHDEPFAFAAGENYFPDEIANTRFYQPTDRGLEQKLAAKREFLDQLNTNSHDTRYK